MKNFYKAFTLAEVLIAIAVIGIAAALTVPNLVRDTQKKIAAATLGKAVEQVQNGCESMIQFANENAEDAVYYDKILLADSAFVQHMAGYIGAKETKETLPTLKKYLSNDNISVSGWGNSTAKRYRFNKLNAEVGITPSMNGYELYRKVADVYINVNPRSGAKNAKLGKDVFLFTMDNACRLIPVGVDNPDACPNDGGTNCAARVVKDGYKITY